MIDTSMFPYSSFPVRLEQKSENRICWFRDEVDLQKHLTRYSIDRRTVKIDYCNEQSIEPSTANPPKVRQRTRKSNSGSSSRTTGKSKKLDSPRNTTRTRKPKQK